MSIADNIKRVHDEIAHACAKAGRSPESVTLVAVSKTHPPEHVLEAIRAGVQHFGENRVEEAVIKIPVVNAQVNVPAIWHMIGHIQSRKAREIIPLFQWVHSVDSVKLAEKLSRQASEQGAELDILLEVNVSGEESKSGFGVRGWQADELIREQFAQDIRQIRSLPGLHLRGLMTMAPIVEAAEEARPVFADLAALREWLSSQVGTALPELSMGMTDDYPIAVQEGATIVRVGRAIFGERTR